MEQYIVYSQTFQDPNLGEYSIQFISPPAATVKLITYTCGAKSVMAMLTNAYTGDYSGVSLDEDRMQLMLEDIQRTKLQTPMEMIHMVWLIQNVTRAFTHQLVRYRVGTAFVQESMRFLGHKGIYKVLATRKVLNKIGEDEVTKIENAYFEGAIAAIRSYVKLIGTGVPSEDARGVLPTNILTNIYFDCSLRTLQNICAQRLCCQAQPGEWQPILVKMRALIAGYLGPEIEATIRAPYELGQDCGFRASFDRPCIWKREKSEREEP